MSLDLPDYEFDTWAALDSIAKALKVQGDILTKLGEKVGLESNDLASIAISHETVVKAVEQMNSSRPQVSWSVP